MSDPRTYRYYKWNRITDEDRLRMRTLLRLAQISDQYRKIREQGRNA